MAKNQRPGRRLSKLTHGSVECGSVVPIPSQQQRLHVGQSGERQSVEAAIPGISALWNGRMTNDPWHKKPLSRGSYTFYPPGYQTTLLGIEAEPEGNCFFAGEHTAPEPGYMNAGVVSGQRAARQLAGATHR